LEILEEKKKEKDQIRNWVEAEPNPPREALDAYAKLEKEIITSEKSLR